MGGMLHRLLCRMGLHSWNYWHMAVSFIEAFPRQANVCRTCRQCGHMEMTDNGINWFERF